MTRPGHQQTCLRHCDYYRHKTRPPQANIKRVRNEWPYAPPFWIVGCIVQNSEIWGTLNDTVSFTDLYIHPRFWIYFSSRDAKNLQNLLTNPHLFTISKVKWSRYRPGLAHRVGRGIALLFHDRGTRRGWVVSSTLRLHFIPGKDTVPNLQEVGWAPGQV